MRRWTCLLFWGLLLGAFNLGCGSGGKADIPTQKLPAVKPGDVKPMDFGGSKK